MDISGALVLRVSDFGSDQINALAELTVDTIGADKLEESKLRYSLDEKSLHALLLDNDHADFSGVTISIKDPSKNTLQGTRLEIVDFQQEQPSLHVVYGDEVIITLERHEPRIVSSPYSRAHASNIRPPTEAF